MSASRFRSVFAEDSMHVKNGETEFRCYTTAAALDICISPATQPVNMDVKVKSKKFRHAQVLLSILCFQSTLQVGISLSRFPPLIFKVC